MVLVHIAPGASAAIGGQTVDGPISLWMDEYDNGTSAFSSGVVLVGSTGTVRLSDLDPYSAALGLPVGLVLVGLGILVGRRLMP